MKYINLRSCLLLVLLTWGVVFNTNAQLIPTPEQVKEVQEKLDKIKELKNQGKPNNDSAIKALAKEAIELADKYYKIPGDNADGEPEYDPDLEGEGEAELSGKKVKVKIGMDGLDSANELATTKYHEIVMHGGQAADSPSRWLPGAKGIAINEVEAYDGELKKAAEHGLSPTQIEEIKKRRQEYYDSLDAANKARIDSLKNAGAPYTMALAPATGTSKPILGTGTAKLYVVSSVFAEDRMMVTIRKLGNLANLLITATVAGRSTTARTDVDGHAILDFSTIATGITVNTPASITCTDINGSRLATANTMVRPGFAWIFDRATANNLPTEVANGTVATIRGNNLGAEAQLACNGRMQETLAASNSEMVVFIDAPNGNGATFVIGSYSVSESRITLAKPSTNPVFQAIQEQPFLMGSAPTQKAQGDATKKTATQTGLGTNRK